MIKACFDQSIGRSAGTTSANREANVDYNLCLEERIIDQFKHFRPDLTFYGEPDDKRPTIEKVREQLLRMRTPIQRLYDWIYNYNPGCKPSCGTMYDSYHLIANGEVLEKILRDVVSQRIEYGF